jgi:hypothetical protein
MRVPKRNAGLIAKALKLGIFAKSPREWARINCDKKIGFFDPQVQAKGGRKGGASRSPAKFAAHRKVMHDLWDDLVFREMKRWQCTPYSAWPESRTNNPDELSRIRKQAAHNRWHVKRGVRSDSCLLCRPLRRHERKRRNRRRGNDPVQREVFPQAALRRWNGRGNPVAA